MSVVHLIFVTLFTFILLVNGSPVDSIEKYEIVVCPENGCKDADECALNINHNFLKIFFSARWCRHLSKRSSLLESWWHVRREK